MMCDTGAEALQASAGGARGGDASVRGAMSLRPRAPAHDPCCSGVVPAIPRLECLLYHA